MLRLIPHALAFLLLGVAAPPATAAAPERCAGAGQRNAAPGFRCATKRGNFFRLVHRSPKGKEFWLDETSGLVWGDVLSERIRRRAAAGLCAKKTEENSYGATHLSRLPTLQDFADAEAHGFREVLPAMKDHFFWIDSRVPGAANIGHMFNGNLGKPEIVVYRSINFETIRCVGRPKAPAR
jgi:hypothetical protein